MAAAARATATKAVTTITRKRPDFTGVPGKLVDAPVGLQFGHVGRGSPYDALLEQLATAPKGKALEFGHVRAKASIWARARKLGIKVLYAESGGILYVQFAGWAPDSERWKQLVRTEIKGVIDTQPRNEIQISNALRAKGIGDVDAGIVGAILKQMEQEKLVLRQRDGSWTKAVAE